MSEGLMKIHHMISNGRKMTLSDVWDIFFPGTDKVSVEEFGKKFQYMGFAKFLAMGYPTISKSDFISFIHYLWADKRSPILDRYDFSKFMSTENPNKQLSFLTIALNLDRVMGVPGFLNTTTGAKIENPCEYYIMRDPNKEQYTTSNGEIVARLLIIEMVHPNGKSDWYPIGYGKNGFVIFGREPIIKSPSLSKAVEDLLNSFGCSAMERE